MVLYVPPAPAHQDSLSNFGMVKYTVLGLLSGQVICAIIMVILIGTDTVHDSCAEKGDPSSTTVSPGVYVAAAGVGLTIVIGTACCCISCLVAEFVVVILELYYAVIFFAVCQAIQCLGNILRTLHCSYAYLVNLLMSVVTLVMFIRYTVLLARVLNYRRAHDGYVVSAPGKQQQYHQQGSYAGSSKVPPSSGALNEA